MNERRGINSSYSRRGDAHGHAKLTDRKVAQIRTWITNDTMTLREIAARYEMSNSAIYHAAVGVTWSHVEHPVVDYVAIKRGRSARNRTSKHEGQTLSSLSRHAFGFLTRRRTHSREALAHVLDRLVGARQPVRLGGVRSTRGSGPLHPTWLSKSSVKWLRACAYPKEAVYRCLDRLVRMGALG